VRRLVLTVLILELVLTGCSGASGPTKPDQPPSTRLAEAKASFDKATYVRFDLHVGSLPDGVQGLLSANGTGTHAPAFTGTVKVKSGVALTAPLVALNGAVYAKLPFAGWSKLDPADYGAPNPADLMSRDGGVSSLLAATSDLREGDSQRSGDHVYTSIAGTLSGAAMQRVFPSAGSGRFDVTYSLDDSNDLTGVEISGPFYPGNGEQTYVIDVDVHAGSVDIKAPI
jgi:lipoprotein LprG